MVLGFHILCTMYGFWLPNDERGSCSDFVRADHLTKFGPAHPVDPARSVANRSFDWEIREMAREALDYPPVKLTGRQALSIGRGFADELRYEGGILRACAILPRHVHLVATTLRYDVRRFAGRLKGAATRRLTADRLHPLEGFVAEDGSVPSPWTRLPWVRFLFTEEDMLRAIRYVESNPEKEGKRRQAWSFVVPWEGTRGAAHHR